MWTQHVTHQQMSYHCLPLALCTLLFLTWPPVQELLGPFAHRLPYFIRQQPSCLGNSLSHTESKMQMLQQALGCEWSEVRYVPPLHLMLLCFGTDVG
jgi:hypothetical protein